MAEHERARVRGHDIEVEVDDHGEPTVLVDGEAVPVRSVDGQFAVTYFAPHADLMEAAKEYVNHLPGK